MELKKKLNGRRQYLVTYSQADLEKFPSREMFANMLEREFNMGTSAVKVSHWACCKETHKKEEGYHYHCALKLTGVKKWVAVKERIQRTYGISVHFSDSHDFYLSAYRYVCKEDTEVAHSAEHPNLAGAKSPVTKKSIGANKRRSQDSSDKKCKKRLRLSNTDVGTFIRKHNIRCYTHLLAVAEERSIEGLSDIKDFLFNRHEKFLRELIEKCWQMAEASEKMKIVKREKIDTLTSFKESPCICRGEWLRCAREVLTLNKISEEEFTSAILKNVRDGRGKYRNIMLVGPTNCAKTFLLKPLSKIFAEEFFENPANHRFGWAGVENASVIMLQDFRWSKELISWKDFLLLLEGENLKLPTPRNIYKEDILVTGNISIFATGKCEITYKGSYNTSDNREDDMMSSRWKMFKFSHQFREEDQKHVQPCGHCFAKFILRS
jgi:hypothetical protein